MKIAIIGGGIVGLNTGLQFQREFRNAQITILASNFEDTVSHVAAGIFRVGSHYSGPTEEITGSLIRNSYEFYDEIRKSCDSSIAGVTHISGYMFANSSQSAVQNQWMEGLVPIYRRATSEEFQIVGGNWKYGSFFKTILIQPNIFLPWARQMLQENGVILKSQTVDSFKELITDYDLIVNCTGLGAQRLCKDRCLVPIRGQITKVKAPWIKTFFYGELDTYIIPGSDGMVTLGGSRHFDSATRNICPYETIAIRNRCEKLLPSLSKATTVKHGTGLRPHREGHVRIEMEKISNGLSTIMVVHNYGHGGYGVCTAPGTSMYATALAKEAHSLSHSKL